MKTVAFLGLGAMGSRMALNLINAGYDVHVWNRTPERAQALIQQGARSTASPRVAAENADVVISMVRDDSASKAIWCDDKTGALNGIKPDAIAIECSTLSLDWIRELHQRASDKNVVFLDAPVIGSRPQADAAQLRFLAGGDASTVDQAKSVLTILGGTVHHAGPATAGATLKLLVNTLFSLQVAAMAEIIGCIKATGLNVTNAIEILASTPVCSVAAGAASEAMLTQQHAPMFPIELATKDLTYAAKHAVDSGLAAPLTHATMSVFENAVACGFGNDNITGVVQLYT